MDKLIVSAGALALLLFSHCAMAGPAGAVAETALDGSLVETIQPRANGTPAETEMPTADTDAAADKAGDQLPQDRRIDQFGDSIDSGHEGG